MTIVTKTMKSYIYMEWFFCIIITVVVIRSCTNLQSRKRGKGRSAQYRTVLQAWFHMLQSWTCKKVQVAFSFIFLKERILSKMDESKRWCYSL